MRPSCLCVHLYICTRGCEKESDRERNRARRVVRGVTGARGGERLSALSRTASQCVCVCVCVSRRGRENARREKWWGSRTVAPSTHEPVSRYEAAGERSALVLSRVSILALIARSLLPPPCVRACVCVQHSSLHNSVHRQRQHLPRLKIHHLWCATRSL